MVELDRKKMRLLKALCEPQVSITDDDVLSRLCKCAVKLSRLSWKICFHHSSHVPNKKEDTEPCRLHFSNKDNQIICQSLFFIFLLCIIIKTTIIHQVLAAVFTLKWQKLYFFLVISLRSTERERIGGKKSINLSIYPLQSNQPWPLPCINGLRFKYTLTFKSSEKTFSLFNPHPHHHNINPVPVLTFHRWFLHIFGSSHISWAWKVQFLMRI